MYRFNVSTGLVAYKHLTKGWKRFPALFLLQQKSDDKGNPFFVTNIPLNLVPLYRKGMQRIEQRNKVFYDMNRAVSMARNGHMLEYVQNGSHGEDDATDTDNMSSVSKAGPSKFRRN